MKVSRLHFIMMFAVTAPVLFGQILDRPVASVRLTETQVIGQREMRRQQVIIERQLGQSLPDAQRRELVDGQVNTVLIMQAAREAGVRVTDAEIETAVNQPRLAAGMTEGQYRAEIERQTGLTWDEYRTQVRDRLIQERYVVQTKSALFQSIPAPTEAQIVDFYESNAAQFVSPAMVRFTHLFVDTRAITDAAKRTARAKMDEFYRQVRSGGVTVFDDLIRRSVDDPSYSGGDFGYLVRSEPQFLQVLGRPFVDAVFALSNGAFSTVLESAIGFHIVRITDKRSPRLLGLDDPVGPGQTVTVRDQIGQALLAQSQQERFLQATREVIAELRARADITVFEEHLNW